METTMKKTKTKTGIISLKTGNGWEPWGIGTFAEAVEAKIGTGAQAFAYCPLTPRGEG